MVNYGSVGHGEVVDGPDDCNYAICTGERSDLFVIESDKIEGAENLARLGPMPNTYTVRTPSGSVHYYFKHPGFDVRNSASKIAKNVDIRGEGGFVVAEGSEHRSGGTYELIKDVPLSEAPDWLLAWLKSELDARPVIQGEDVRTVDPDTQEGKRRIGLAAEYLRTAKLSKAGEGGQGAFYVICMHLMRRYELPVDVAAGLIEDVYNPRLIAIGEDPWMANDPDIRYRLDRKLNEGLKGALIPGCAPATWETTVATLQGAETPVDFPESVERRVRNPKHQYTFEIGGHPNVDAKKTSLAEIVAMLCELDAWRGVFQFDTFRKRIIAVDPPLQLEGEDGNRGISDIDVLITATWFEVVGRKAVSPTMMDQAIGIAAMRCKFHPVHDYLQGLQPWDGTPLFGTLSKNIFGDATPISEVFFSKFLVASVRRMLVPGTKVDTMLVLYSAAQGMLKSQFVFALFGDQFARDQMPDLKSKDASQALNGYWGVELGELEGIVQAENTTVKSFLSRCYDDYRPPYGRKDQRFPRECVFIGTTNDDDFLRDPSGSRRFWPIRLPDDRSIDLAWLRAHRDRIWAEALHHARDAQYKHWLTPEEEVLASEERASFEQEDMWTDKITDYLRGRERVTSTDVFLKAVAKGDENALAKMGRREQLRICNTLRRLGCTSYYAQRSNGTRFRSYIVPDNLRVATPSEEEQKRRAAEEAILASLALAKKN